MRAALIIGAVVAGTAVAIALLLGTDGTLAGFTDYVRGMQATLQQALVGGVRRWQQTPDGAALGALGMSCFLYGVFHAVGPGHGKAVLTTYAATTDVSLPRVVALSGLSAFTQATVAVVLVSVAFWVIGASARWVNTQAERFLEPASYAAIAAVGLWLVVGGVRSVMPRRVALAGHGHDHGHGHGHGHGHDHTHRHDAECCGGHHHPTAEATTKGASLRSGIVLAMAAGLRPCTGSLLVLFLCFGLGLWTLGIVAAYAIGVGTAITVAALAAGAHAARHPAAWLARLTDLPADSTKNVTAGVKVAGGAIILLLGATLLQAALKAPAHPIL